MAHISQTIVDFVIVAEAVQIKIIVLLHTQVDEYYQLNNITKTYSLQTKYLEFDLHNLNFLSHIFAFCLNHSKITGV